MSRLMFLITAFLSFAAPASAQFGQGGDQDIFVNATKATYKDRLTILEGAVDVRQGDAQILSDIMHIYRAKADDAADGSIQMGAVTRIEAEGSFVYITPDTRVTGLRGVYERDTDMITVTGDVKVTQTSGNTATTDKLFYNVKTETIRFAGDCLGKDCKSRPSIRLNE